MALMTLEYFKKFIDIACKQGFIPIALNGKQPVLPGWQHIQKENALDKIELGFKCYGANNIGIRCGEVSNIVIVDIDVKNDGLSTWNELISAHGDPQTFNVFTGSGGYHYFFQYNSDNAMLKSRSCAVKHNGVKVGIDIRSNGGQVVFMGSILPETGERYELDNNSPIAIMSMWLLTLLLETEKFTSNTTNKQSKDETTNHNESVKSDQGNNPPVLSEAALTELLNNLHSDRSSNYDDWIRVVWAIKSMSPNYYHIACKFSQCTKRNNFDETALQKVWNDGKGNIGLGSLMYWLKQDAGESVYSNFVKKHKLTQYHPEPVPISTIIGGKTINNHEDKMTWHGMIQKYHCKSVWDVAVVVKDMIQCVALIAGGKRKYFVKDQYDEWDALHYTLTKTRSFKDDAKEYYFMECKKEKDSTITRTTWIFKQVITTYLSRCSYKRIEFSPAGNKPHAINLFTGLRAKYIDKYQINDIVPILNHIREVLCNDDVACYEYFLNKLAYFFQFLGIKKVGVADMVISSQSIGKNIFYEHLGRYILGDQHWYITSDINKLTGRFNKVLSGRLMIIGDEAKGHGKTADAIKPLITQDVQWVEPKGSEQFQISDWAMYVFFANSARYFEVEQEDRRYLVLHGSDRYKRNNEYFNLLSNTFKKFSNEFYSFLMDRDISDFNIQNIPTTSIKTMLQEAAGSSCQVFVKTWDWMHSKRM